MRCLYQGHTLVRPLPNCLCHILKHSCAVCDQCQYWSQPFAWSTPVYPADPVRRSTSHVAGESPLTADKLVSMPSQMRNSQDLISPTQCWKSFLPGQKCWTCVGWDGVLILSSVLAAFRRHKSATGLSHAGVNCHLARLSRMCHWLGTNMLSSN